MKPHFLQSVLWSNFQKKIGRVLVEGSGKNWSYVGIVEHDRFGTYVYVPYGPYATNKKALLEAVEDLKKQSAARGAYVVSIEPTAPITLEVASSLFKYKGTHRQAHRTLRIDLDREEEAILSDMSKTRRKQYRNYHKKNLTMQKSNTRETLDTFYDLLKISSGEKGFYVRDKSFFEAMFDTLVQTGNASLFTAIRDGNSTEVAALVYDDEDTRYYAHVGRDLSDNSLQASAPLIAYMIFDARSEGKKYFDLYGISERDDKIDEKSGFTAFKKTFGGEVIQYGGAWDIPLNTVKYNSKRLFGYAKSILRRLGLS